MLTFFSRVYTLQKVNCPEVIRLLMTYNFLPEATQLSLEYMNAFMGHGTEYFDIKVSLLVFISYVQFLFLAALLVRQLSPTSHTNAHI